jgi:hypothetical protein
LQIGSGYLSGLSNGEHSYVLTFQDGAVWMGSFEVVGGSTNPGTGGDQGGNSGADKPGGGDQAGNPGTGQAGGSGGSGATVPAAPPADSGSESSLNPPRTGAMGSSRSFTVPAGLLGLMLVAGTGLILGRRRFLRR